MCTGHMSILTVSIELTGAIQLADVKSLVPIVFTSFPRPLPFSAKFSGGVNAAFEHARLPCLSSFLSSLLPDPEIG